jgi:hypothetical protein
VTKDKTNFAIIIGKWQKVAQGFGLQQLPKNDINNGKLT